MPLLLPAQSTTRPVSPPAPRPTLVVQITVDQLRPDYFDRYASQLTGGLGRLMRQGAFFRNAQHDHATTETAPGHATLWSGRYPSHNGVVLNELGVLDAQAPLLYGRGTGASPFRFRGTSFFDWVRAQDPNSRALSVSRKDRGAILPLGRAKQSVFWYGLDGRFTTSRYYGDTVPTWVQQFNAQDVTKPYLGTPWTLLLDPSAYAEPDSVAVENSGKDFVFPHLLTADPRAGTNSFTEYPWMDDITVAFALAGVKAMKLGAGPSMDVLAVSLSTTDAVGHRYGPDSRELHDQVLRVDRAIGRLMDSLFVLRDSTRIVFALSADHGVSPYPELHFPGTDPERGRVNPMPPLTTLKKALVAKGVDSTAVDIMAGIVFVDRAKVSAVGLNVDSMVTALQKALKAVPGMQRVDRVRDLAAAARRNDVIARRWLHSIPEDFQAELTVTFMPFAYWPGVKYATHGTPHDLDAQIPILFMGPMITPGRYTVPVRSVDIAPTLAAMTGVRPLEAVDGRPLTEALAGAQTGASRRTPRAPGHGR